MKYWRGYLVAAAAAAGAWGLKAFASTHGELVDMVYPYISRMIQTFLASWSAQVSFCVWQVAIAVLFTALLATVVLMIVFKWNPIRWLGWVLAAASVIGLLNTGIYGLNEYASSLAADIHLTKAEYQYDLDELEAAAIFYRDKAIALSGELPQELSDFETLAEQAAEGFRVLTYEKHLPVFSGATEPVKKLNNADFLKSNGITSLTVPLTGESAVNAEIPPQALPFIMCHEMAHRMTIAIDSDADFAAFLACDANSSVEFRYSAYFMAFLHCYDALKTVQALEPELVENFEFGITEKLRADMDSYYAFFGKEAKTNAQAADLLVVWHIQEYVLPQYQEEEKPFDPKDEDAVDLSGNVNAKPKE